VITVYRDGAVRLDPRRAGYGGGPGRRPLGPVHGDASAGFAGEAARHRLLAHAACPDGERLVGLDNAHLVARQKRGEPPDHRHRLRTIRAYEYRNAATLLADFWETVDAVLRERGVIP
jgi:hypothetical protein